MAEPPLPPVNWSAFKYGLLDWYEPDRRPMPWKGETNPYLIWLSEVILQQTRVEQGRAYFEKFKRNYPTVEALAGAADDRVMKDWEGLGYYSRARNLLRAARMVRDEYGGKFPGDYKGLLKLPGVGPYTAAAIASFAYGEAVPVLDGNVYRVLARYAAETTEIATSLGKKKFTQLAAAAFDPRQPARYNQAIMDFGALVCRPKSPLCKSCPLTENCLGLMADLVEVLPVKAKKAPRRNRYFHYVVIENEAGEWLVRQRVAGDVWADLYEFPLVETATEDEPEPEDLPARIESIESSIACGKLDYQRRSALRRQQLTHQNIYIRFYEFSLAGNPPPAPPGYGWVSAAEAGQLAFPKTLATYIRDKSVFFDLFS